MLSITESVMPTSRPSPDDFLPLTHLGFHILLALVDQPLHGYAIVRAVRAQSQGKVDPGTGSFYSIVRGLSEQTLIEPIDGPAGDQPDRRRYYALTPLGRRVLAAESARLAGLVREVHRRGVGRPAKAGGR
jgi:DNA-binding PadR family transcriptional regulator